MTSNCGLLLPAVILILSAAPSPVAPAGPQHPSPSRADVLRRAGIWVERFADDSASIVATEQYRQVYEHGSGSARQVEERTLVSEIAVVKTRPEEQAAGYPWVQFRDVLEVDGTPLPDHQGRLERLFAEGSPSSYARAASIAEESARFNIGPGVRTVNVPLFALFFLVPGNQRRFRFDVKGEEEIGTAHALVVAYRERERPTMIRSPGRQDRPAAGTLWIDADSGRVLKTRLVVESEKSWVMETEVIFGRDAHANAWVALRMHERYHRGSNESLDCTATYSNFRRFSTSARIIPR